MWLLIVEALIALALLIFIVAWTMSGRRREGTGNDDQPTDEGPRR